MQDTTGGSLKDLELVTRDMVAAGNARPELAGLFSPFSASTPQLHIDLDRTKALTEGVSIGDVFDALQTFLGGIYVNDFNIYGRVYKVYLQADVDARQAEEDIGRLYVRNDSGGMVPLSALVTVHPEIGARTINHYNLFRSTSINGAPGQGYSSSQAITAMDSLSKQVLPQGYTYEWTGNAYQELKAGNVAPILFALAVIFAFLFLAAQYESFVMPLMVLLAVPLAIFGALSAQWLRGYDNNIYCQIGLVMLIGLASKGAILVVEFARRRREEGLSIEEIGDGGGTHPASAGSDDRFRLHPGCCAAGDCHGRRIGCTPIARHRRFRRHDRGHGAQPGVGARALRAASTDARVGDRKAGWCRLSEPPVSSRRRSRRTGRSFHRSLLHRGRDRSGRTGRSLRTLSRNPPPPSAPPGRFPAAGAASF